MATVITPAVMKVMVASRERLEKRDAADAVAAGAAGTEPGTETYQQPADHREQHPGAGQGRFEVGVEQGRQAATEHNAEHEQESPRTLARGLGEDSGENAADAGDAAVQGHHHDGGDADQAAADGRQQEGVHAMPPEHKSCWVFAASVWFGGRALSVVPSRSVRRSPHYIREMQISNIYFCMSGEVGYIGAR